METGCPIAWRVIATTSEGQEEVVFHVPGILVAKNLPPMEKPLGKHVKIGQLRQAVTILGLGSELFEEAVKGIMTIDDNFRCYIGDKEIEDTTVLTVFMGYSAIDISNRYFTSRSLARHEMGQAIGQHINPKGILSKAASEGGYMHTAENVVEYQQCKINTDGEQWYQNISPRVFQIGDIVEVQLSLMSAKTGKGGDAPQRTIGVLRCVTLLDNSLTTEARQNERARTSKVTLKRRIGNTNTLISAEQNERIDEVNEESAQPDKQTRQEEESDMAIDAGNK